MKVKQPLALYALLLQFVVGASALFPIAPAVAGQLPSALAGPVLGFLFNSGTGKMQPLQGMLGNSTMGAPVEIGISISQVLPLGPRQAIASAEESSEILMLDMESSPVSVRAVPEAPARPSQAGASQHGSAAALYYAADRTVLVVTGLPLAPKVSRRVDLSALGLPLTRIAISDDGTVLAFAIAEDGQESLYGWTQDFSTRYLMSLDSIGGLTVRGDGNAIIVADRRANVVYAVWNARASTVRQLLATSHEGVSEPVGVAVSDRNEIYVANIGSGTVTVLDSLGRVLREKRCNCEISGLAPLRDSLFRLTERLDATIFLLDASSGDDRILFVPPWRETK